jgi:hypothetical protein
VWEDGGSNPASYPIIMANLDQFAILWVVTKNCSRPDELFMMGSYAC